MSQAARRRRTMLRSGFAACALAWLLISAAWLISCRWTVFSMAQFGDSVGLRAGCVFYLWTTPALRLRFHDQSGWPLELTWQGYLNRRTTPMQWWVTPYTSTPSGRRSIDLPLWPLWIATTIGVIVLWRKLRRFHLPGHCHQCGYDRTGLPIAAVCPECGAEPNSGPYALSPAE